MADDDKLFPKWRELPIGVRRSKKRRYEFITGKIEEILNPEEVDEENKEQE